MMRGMLIDPRRSQDVRIDARLQQAVCRGYVPPFVITPGEIREITNGDGPSWLDMAAISVTATAVVPYVQSIAIELGKRTVDSAPRVVRDIRCHFRFTRRKKFAECAEIDLIHDQCVTTVELTSDLSEDAWLALLDMDFSAPEVRGKTFRWDGKESAWKDCGSRERRRT